MKLICFGDSWTAGHGVEEFSQYQEIANPDEFIKRLREQNSWPRWLGEKLNSISINMGVCGYGNLGILNELLGALNNGFIKSNDLIVIMLSYPYRYSKKDNKTVIEIYNDFEKALENYTHFYFNSFYPTFKDEDYDTSTLPKYFINPNGCVSDILRQHELINDISVWEYESRSVYDDITNFYKGDYHPNLLGYKLIADYIFNEIENYGQSNL